MRGVQLPNLVHTGEKIKSKNGSIKITSYILLIKEAAHCVSILCVYEPFCFFVTFYLFS